MRRRTFTTMLAGLACAIAVSGPLLAQAQAPKAGSPAEARAMLERAVQALRADKQKALTAFTRGTKGFRQRDLYVFCFGPDGKVDAHPNPALIGMEPACLRIKTARRSGWRCCKWRSPAPSPRSPTPGRSRSAMILTVTLPHGARLGVMTRSRHPM